MITDLMSSIVALFIGSTCKVCTNRLTTDLFKYSGIGNIPAINQKIIHKYSFEAITNSKHLIFLKSVGTCSSSKGN